MRVRGVTQLVGWVGVWWSGCMGGVGLLCHSYCAVRSRVGSGGDDNVGGSSSIYSTDH